MRIVGGLWVGVQHLNDTWGEGGVYEPGAGARSVQGPARRCPCYGCEGSSGRRTLAALFVVLCVSVASCRHLSAGEWGLVSPLSGCRAPEDVDISPPRTQHRSRCTHLGRECLTAGCATRTSPAPS